GPMHDYCSERASRARDRNGGVDAARQQERHTLDDASHYLERVMHTHQRPRSLGERLSLLTASLRILVEACGVQGQRRLVCEGLEEPPLTVAELDGMAVRHGQRAHRPTRRPEGHCEERTLTRSDHALADVLRPPEARVCSGTSRAGGGRGAGARWWGEPAAPFGRARPATPPPRGRTISTAAMSSSPLRATPCRSPFGSVITIRAAVMGSNVITRS